MWSRSKQAVTSESGSAIVEFISVAVLLVALTCGVVQVALLVHVRNTLQDAAIEGAYRAALVGQTPAGAGHLVRGLISTALGKSFDANVAVSVHTNRAGRVATVEITTALPVIGLWGPAATLTTRGSAPLEYLGGVR